jgi:hypothetical protein
MSRKHMGGGGIAPTSLAPTPYEGELSPSRPDRFTTGEGAPGTHWIGDWVGSKIGLDAVNKSNLVLPRIEPGSSSPLLYRLSYHNSFGA